MTRKPDLNGLRVLVTRPQPGASRTTGYLQELGATVTCFPLLGIRAVNPGPEIRSVISDLDNVDLLVFVSANAVNSLLGILEDSGQVLCSEVKIAAVGSATESALISRNFSVTYRPRNRIDSEGLITILDQDSWQGKKVIIVRGQGGRGALKAFLASRGATVTYLELYQRVPLEAPDTDTLSQWSIRPFDAALASSVSVFDATLDALGDQAAGILGSSTIVCPSQRVAEHCQSRVSNSILVATGPSDEETAQELGKIARQR